MKRIIIIILAVFSLISCICCDWTHTEEPSTTVLEPYVFNQDTDFDNRFGNGARSVVETEDAYYFIIGQCDYLYCYDKLSGEYGFLCGKPECMHDSESCNARIRGGRSGVLNHVNGRLYFKASDTNRGPGVSMGNCYSVSLDGTDRRLEFEMHCEWQNEPMVLYFHRGKFYGASMADFVVNGVPGKHIGITSWDAETGDYRLIFSRDDCEGYPMPRLFFFGKYVYFCFASAEVTENTSFSTLEIYRWDTEAEKLETVFKSGKHEIPGEAYTIWVGSENEIYIAPTIPQTNETSPVYLLRDGELSEVFRFDDPGALCLRDGIVIRNLLADDYRSFEMHLTDYEGNTIYRGTVNAASLNEAIPGIESISYYNNSCYGDRQTLYYCCSIKKTGNEKWIDCIIKFNFKDAGAEPEATVICVDTPH